MLRKGRQRVPEQGGPPPGESVEDVGQRAIEEYREWRRQHMKGRPGPEMLRMPELLATMRDEQPGK